MLHVLQRDGLVDTAFLADHTVGWEDLAALLPPCTPDWAAAQTGVAVLFAEILKLVFCTCVLLFMVLLNHAIWRQFWQ